tara:strand:- start:2126 stop:2713 length:588 start_codon:yes stop_codon:yes gene_type:complete
MKKLLSAAQILLLPLTLIASNQMLRTTSESYTDTKIETNLWAENHSKKAQTLFDESSLTLGQISKSRVPLFSSIDGYVSFLLSADIIKPAKRKVGVFTIPKHGLVVENLSLDFRDVKITAQDWLKVIEMVEPLKAMSMLGDVRVIYPGENEVRATSAPLVYKNQIYFSLHEKNSLRLTYSAKSQQVNFQILNSTN